MSIITKCLGNYDMIMVPRRIWSLVNFLDGMDYGWETSGGGNNSTETNAEEETSDEQDKE